MQFIFKKILNVLKNYFYNSVFYHKFGSTFSTCFADKGCIFAYAFPKRLLMLTAGSATTSHRTLDSATTSLGSALSSASASTSGGTSGSTTGGTSRSSHCYI
jgi:hypothetical protein